MNYHYLYSTLRFLFVLAIIIAGSIALFYISSVTYPFIIAFIIAFLINPAVNFFQQKGKMPRALAVFIALILIFAIVAGLITILVAEIISGSNYLAKVVPTKFENLVVHIEQFFAGQIIPIYNQILSLFNTLETGQQASIMENIENVGTTIATKVSGWLEAFLKAIPNVLGWLPNAATVIIFSLLATFFISKDWYKLSSFIKKVMPTKVQSSTKTVFAQLKKALLGFVKAQLTLISITAVIVLIGLLFLKVEYAITIALLIGLVDILPYLGTGAVFVPWIIYAIFQGDTGFALGLGILYIIVLVQRQVMEPKILSTNIDLDPLATLIALFVGFKLFGFLGLIIGPVTLVIGKTLHQAHVFQDIWAYIIGKKAA